MDDGYSLLSFGSTRLPQGKGLTDSSAESRRMQPEVIRMTLIRDQICCKMELYTAKSTSMYFVIKT